MYCIVSIKYCLKKNIKKIIETKFGLFELLKMAVKLHAFQNNSYRWMVGMKTSLSDITHLTLRVFTS